MQFLLHRLIDRCRRPCAGGHRIEVEIVTPEIAGLMVTDGGRIEVRGDFPAQPSVAASVSSGGMIDMRALAASQISASIAQGGRILARPLRAMNASVSNGGLVTYWGDPDLVSSVRDGGGVVKGAAADLRRPIQAFDPAPPPVPPVPPVTSVGRH